VFKHTKHTKKGRGVHKAMLRGKALGYKPHGSKGMMAIKHKKVKAHRKKGGGKHSYSSHGVRHHKHKTGVKPKTGAYCKRPYASTAKKLGA